MAEITRITNPKPVTLSTIISNVITLLGIIVVIVIFWKFILPRIRKRIRPPDEMNWPDLVNWKNEPKVPSILLQTQEGYSDMKKVVNVSGEFLLDPFDKERKAKKKEVIYTGMPAHILNITTDIFPGRAARFLYGFLYPFGLRVRMYHRLYDEPCTRNLYTGELLRPEKKRKVLVEKGVIDEEGFFLTPKEFDTKGMLTNGGDRLVLKGCWVKPDFSDVDFIKSEFHAYKQSEAVEKTADAMSKTGRTFDKWFFIVLIVAFGAMVLVVLMMSGIIK